MSKKPTPSSDLSADNEPAAAAGNRDRAQAAWNRESVEALRLLVEQRARMKGLFFWGAAFFTAAFLALIVFFVLFINESGENLEASISKGIPGFGQAVADVVRLELQDGKRLQEEIMELRRKDEEMRRTLAASEHKVLDLDRKEREQRILLDRKRVELEEMRKLYDELLDRKGKPQEASREKPLSDPGDQAMPEKGEGGEGEPQDVEDKVFADVEETMKELNRILFQSGKDDFKIVGCQGVEETLLLEPTIAVQKFQGNEPAVLLPKKLVFFRNGKVVEMTSSGGGTFCPDEGSPEPLPEGAVKLTFQIDSLEMIKDEGLRRLLKLDPLDQEIDSDDPSGVLARINALLERDKGREYRFVKIDAVEETCLRGVEIERYEPTGDVKSSVIAEKCVFMLYPRDRFLMIHFEKGTIGYGGKQTPFYNDQLNWNILSIDPDLWREQAFAFLKEE